MHAGDWKSMFLASLSETGNVSASCRFAGISRQAAYEARKDDAVFAQGWGDAIEEGTDALEEIARKRAKTESDTLLIFLLKAHRPKIYRDNLKLEHDGGVDVRVIYETHDHDYLTATPSGTVSDSAGSEAV
jgi:hypothetical protein